MYIIAVNVKELIKPEMRWLRGGITALLITSAQVLAPNHKKIVCPDTMRSPHWGTDKNMPTPKSQPNATLNGPFSEYNLNVFGSEHGQLAVPAHGAGRDVKAKEIALIRQRVPYIKIVFLAFRYSVNLKTEIIKVIEINITDKLEYWKLPKLLDDLIEFAILNLSSNASGNNPLWGILWAAKAFDIIIKSKQRNI